MDAPKKPRAEAESLQDESSFCAQGTPASNPFTAGGQAAFGSDPLTIGGQPPRVLIIDDDDVFRTVLRAYLEHAGFEVEEAVDGESGLVQFEEQPADIVLLDIMMPGVDGFETCETIRRQAQGRRVPIVMMTALDDHEAIERAYQVGATDFIAKPINSFVLIRRLQHILRANRFMAYFDGLTGLPTRDLFVEQLRLAISAARRHDRYVAVLFVNLDNFTRFNDTLGHRVGDEILRQVADRLGELRAGDVSSRILEQASAPTAESFDQPIARFGSDEFMVVLTDIRHEKDIALVAQRVGERLARPFFFDGEEIHVTASIGISAYPLDGRAPQQLVERAAVAMKHAKQAGKARYQFYSEGLNERTQARLSIENQLRRALDRGELAMHYQPKVDLRENRIGGLEALARMFGPGGAPVSPAQFIPIAEETGLIGQVGEWVFRTSCEDFAKLRQAGAERLELAINLSAGQFRNEGLLSMMLGAIEETGLQPSDIELELTEGILLEDTEASIATLREFKDIGFRIAVDDFGTGYSSLSYLKRFPIDVLKVDQSFVRGLPGDRGDAAIVEAIIDLGHKLGLRVVAEGVEQESQLAFLRERGCDVIQGFLYSRALPRAELAEWLEQWEESEDAELIRNVRASIEG